MWEDVGGGRGLVVHAHAGILQFSRVEGLFESHSSPLAGQISIWMIILSKAMHTKKRCRFMRRLTPNSPIRDTMKPIEALWKPAYFAPSRKSRCPFMKLQNPSTDNPYYGLLAP